MTRTGILSTLARRMRLAQRSRRKRRAIRLLNSLPPEIQADIGWPDLHLDASGRFVTLERESAKPRYAALPAKAGWAAPSIPPECPV